MIVIKKILVVDDDKNICELLNLYLKKEGYEVVFAYDGSEAVNMAKTENPNLILLDVMMPVMNGYEATEKIRSSNHPLATTIPIIAQTANAFQDDIKKVKEVGMNAHISKPIEEENLLKILAEFKK